MAIGDFENALPRRLTRKLAAYSSSWWDMRHALQIMHARSLLSEGPAHYFARRGLLDGAVITYARCFADGRRTPNADIKALRDELTPRLRQAHETVMLWRNKHAGHRVDENLEDVDMRVSWGNFNTGPPVVRVRVSTRVRPDNLNFEADFEALAQWMADSIWREFLQPLKEQMFIELGADRLAELKATASPYAVPATREGEVMVTMDIASMPPAVI